MICVIAFQKYSSNFMFTALYAKKRLATLKISQILFNLEFEDECDIN